MHITNFLQMKGQQIWKLKSLLPQASALIESTVEAIKSSTASIHLLGPTAEEIVKDLDLRNKKCLITGASSGIGLELARCLSARGSDVLMACRNAYAASIAIKANCEDPHRFQIGEVNLTSLRSVKNFTDEVLKEEKKFDMVILNAGIFGIPWSLTEDGIETVFQVNYLSQIYLLMKIEKLLTNNARIVFLSSESHRNLNWPMEKRLIPTEKQVSLPKEEYTSIKAYNVSKLCGILGMHALSYQWLDTGRGLFAANPGSFVRTRLCRNWWPYEMLYFIMQPFSKSVSQAASTPIHCAVSPDLEGVTDMYMSNCKRSDASDLAMDTHLSFRIMDLTQDVIQRRVETFDAPRTAATHATHSADKAQPDKLKDTVDEEHSLISNYSG